MTIMMVRQTLRKMRGIPVPPDPDSDDDGFMDGVDDFPQIHLSGRTLILMEWGIMETHSLMTRQARSRGINNHANLRCSSLGSGDWRTWRVTYH